MVYKVDVTCGVTLAFRTPDKFSTIIAQNAIDVSI